MNAIKIIFINILIFCQTIIQAQTNIDDSTQLESRKRYEELISKEKKFDSKNQITNLGVAVSPSNMRFKINPGKTETKILTITNDTYNSYQFRILFKDTEMSREGTVKHLPVDKFSKYSLSKWITANPNFIELKPGEKKEVKITVKVPDSEDANRAAWCVGIVDNVVERDEIATDPSSQSISVGIMPSFGFAVYFYQNPPSLEVNEVEILDFSFTYDEDNKYIHLLAKNMGEGIAKAKVYIELNELNTGFEEKLDLQVFNILPQREREFDFLLPGKMPKGRYSIMGVLDFGSNVELKAASKEIIIQ
jgi:hypothetical protein